MSKKNATTIAAGRGESLPQSAAGAALLSVEQQPFWDSEVYLEDDSGGVSTVARGITGDMYPDNPWDLVVLAGNPLPGLWSATATPNIQLDVQKPAGFDGAALVSRGYVNGGITLTGRLWTPEQWAQWQRVLPLIWRRPDKFAVADGRAVGGQVQGQQSALEIQHPGINSLGITAIVIKSITPPEPTSDVGVRQIKITAVEYVPPPQRKLPADKKTVGVLRGDRTVQAAAIARERAATIAQSKANDKSPPPLPRKANAVLPPSISQARAKLPQIPEALRQ